MVGKESGRVKMRQNSCYSLVTVVPTLAVASMAMIVVEFFAIVRSLLLELRVVAGTGAAGHRIDRAGLCKSLGCPTLPVCPERARLAFQVNRDNLGQDGPVPPIPVQ